ncbi:efflux RND transporter periplasmic adaptor subunit [Opitutia bacterium ISCC 51]|nr:efflux RND transporter periplasmic adaptor subunit [Opitutae bacterium ISCC 51]QXD29694.1 efflux RND transporter periplasmic adaptor subunit [Opitutae bacterium ISCC 52]
MKKFIIIIILLGGVGYGGYRFYFQEEETSETTENYNYAKIERKNILNMITATGSLEARELVEIGSQVSGVIEGVYKDFNDTVEEGDLIALIDPRTLDTQVKSAEADLTRQQANLKRATIQYERFKPVYDKGFLSGDDFLNYEIGKETAEANVKSSEASVDRAKRNREFAEIRAPISGVIINRDVEEGQTVASSFNTPRLFIIAEDLNLMEILANVDESDIGQIKKDQEVRFTVASYPERNFTGTVTEIRLQPTVIQNVVNYTVVVETENPRRLLLPGMTATLDFVVDEVEEVLSVPASALSLKMSDEMVEVQAKFREEMLAQRQASRGGEGGQRGQGGDGGQRRQRPEGFAGGGGAGFGGGQRGGGGRAAIGTIWYKDDAGELKMMMVRTGVTDGITTEVLPLRDEEIPEGREIISKVLTPSTSEAATRAQNPFGGRGRGGGIF